MMRTLFGAVVVAVAGLLPAPAGATPLCFTVVVTSSLAQPVVVGPVCVPFSGSATCHVTTVNVGSVGALHVSYCQPR